MRLVTEVGIFIGLLRAAIVILALGAVALFARISPTVERIMSENVVTLVSAEEMLAVLAQEDLPEVVAMRQFSAALQRAKVNTSERAERPLLEAIDQTWVEALKEGAAPRARAQLVAHIIELSQVNRRSIESASREANRLGTAGAWAAVLLGLFIITASHLFSSRLDTRVVLPLLDIAEVVRAAEGGDPHRRCAERGTQEIRAIASGLNRLLDLASSWRSRGAATPARDRAVLGHLMDRLDGAWLVVDVGGEILSANAEARQRLEGGRSLPEDASVLTEEDVVQDAVRLVRLAPVDEETAEADPEPAEEDPAEA